jgi:glucose/arabinose dehydrogenase
MIRPWTPFAAEEESASDRVLQANTSGVKFSSCFSNFCSLIGKTSPGRAKSSKGKNMKTMGKTTDSCAFLRTIRCFVTLGFLTAVLLILTAPSGYALQAVRIAGGFDQPVGIAAPPGDTSRLFVVEHTGKIKIINLPSGVVNEIPFLDISSEILTGNEPGLLAMAFDPNYAVNGRFYVSYTAPPIGHEACINHIAEFTVSADPDIADPSSETALLLVIQPQVTHDMNWLGFSPRPGDEGNLYIGSGDGGGECDDDAGHIEPGGNSQNITTLLGKILRIHPEAAPGTYSIPPDNPFVGMPPPVKQEIWAFGLRQPVRCSWDRRTRAMFIAEVGGGLREEIDVQKPSDPNGANYGWRIREGLIQSPCPQDGGAPPFTDPVFDYDHSVGQSVVGGYVYRGNLVRQFKGLYVFADYLGPESGDLTGRIWTLRYDGHVASDFRDVTSRLFPTRIGNFPLNNPVAFWEDNSGELYIADIGNGNIYMIKN